MDLADAVRAFIVGLGQRSESVQFDGVIDRRLVMARHLADHRSVSQGARMMRFLAIDRDRDGAFWRPLVRRPQNVSGNRRVVEFLRIARQRPD